MTLRCKPGDLAYIIKAAIPENVGRIVRVIELVGKGIFVDLHGNRFLVDAEHAWYFEAEGAPLAATSTNRSKFLINFGTIHDSRLRPISGVPVNEDVPESVTA